MPKIPAPPTIADLWRSLTGTGPLPPVQAPSLVNAPAPPQAALLNQFYDYAQAIGSGAQEDPSGHWPSEFKQVGHPDLVVGGFDTRNGNRVPGTERLTGQALVDAGWDPGTVRELDRQPDLPTVFDLIRRTLGQPTAAPAPAEPARPPEDFWSKVQESGQNVADASWRMFTHPDEAAKQQLDLVAGIMQHLQPADWRSPALQPQADLAAGAGQFFADRYGSVQQALDTFRNDPVGALSDVDMVLSMALPALLGKIVYHGSPHTFRRFNSAKIGTGEGAASYGHGMYFAENPDVATQYFRQLQEQPEILEMSLAGRGLKRGDQWLDYSPRGTGDLENVWSTVAENALIDEHGLRGAHARGGEAEVQRYILQDLDRMIKDYWNAEYDQNMIRAAEQLRDQIAQPGGVTFSTGPTKGGVYTVDLPDPDIARMLDLDALFGDQSPEVQAALRRLGVEAPAPMGPWKAYQVTARDVADGFFPGAKPGDWVSGRFDLDNRLVHWGGQVYGNEVMAEENAMARQAMDHGNMNGMRLYEQLASRLWLENPTPGLQSWKEGPKRASQALAREGIPGNVYWDQGSRQAGQGTRNFVVFEPEKLKIVKGPGRKK